MTLDEPATFSFDDQVWEPQNYDAYDGEITWRRALAMSRNLATIHVGEAIGFDQVAAVWRRVGVGTPPRAVPAITLGVFELTPLEVAQAYTIFLNEGQVRPLTSIHRIETAERELLPKPPVLEARRASRHHVSGDEHDAQRHQRRDSGRRRAAGFALDAAGKTGTTNDLRDAWFVGFTPELLTVVWVGYDNNQPVSLSGTQAALPIWTAFMKAAVAGRPSGPFEVPEGITFAEIDRDTGKLSLPACPRVYNESFLTGHGADGILRTASGGRTRTGGHRGSFALLEFRVLGSCSRFRVLVRGSVRGLLVFLGRVPAARPFGVRGPAGRCGRLRPTAGTPSGR